MSARAAQKTQEILIGTFSALLLASFGLQVFLAPVTVPTLWFVARRARPIARTVLTFLAVATMLFVGSLVGGSISETGPIPWLFLIGLPAATAAAFVAAKPPAAPA